MKTTSFYYYEDAQKYANDLAEEIGGFVSDKEIEVGPESASFREVEQWSGTTPAIQVCDDAGRAVEFVAYWSAGGE